MNENQMNMEKVTKNSVLFLQFPSEFLQGAQVVHGFSTRIGGVSKGHLSSMNLSFTRGDEEENVLENYRRIAKAIGFDYRNLVAGDQTHTTNIRVVTKEDCGKGIIRKKDYQDIDGLITNQENIPLVTYYADCVPLYFIDMKRRAIGLSHSGWRGTVNRMGAKTIEALQREYGCLPADIKVGIGPSICSSCYEVGREVAVEFQKEFGSYQKEILEEKENGKYQLDLWKANEIVLLEAGVRKENIRNSAICTCCHADWLFSHRATNGKRGNLAAFLMLTKGNDKEEMGNL